MLSTGSPAPQFSARPVSGLTVDVAAITAKRPLLLVFFRYSGSGQTRRDAVALNDTFRTLDLEGIAMAGVIEGSKVAVWDFVPRFGLLYPIVHDATGQIYEQYAVGRDRGLVRTFLHTLRGPQLARAASTAAGFGHGWPEGPLDRLPAAVLIKKGGEVGFTWSARWIFDAIDPEALVQAARSA